MDQGSMRNEAERSGFVGLDSVGVKDVFMADLPNNQNYGPRVNHRSFQVGRFCKPAGRFAKPAYLNRAFISAQRLISLACLIKRAQLFFPGFPLPLPPRNRS